jgi:ubiquinone/menaquinone biosynthesis C-methylase UbiE
MDTRDAVALIAPAMPAPGGVWADLGAGGGTFTRALARLLGAAGRVYAVDHDARAVEGLRALARRGDGGAPVTAILGDLATWRGPDASTAASPNEPLDGILVANALHYVASNEQAAVLARLARLLHPAGRVVVVEYDGRSANRWVPYPVDRARLAALAAAAGLGTPRLVGERRSAYGGTIYAAWLPARPGPAGA